MLASILIICGASVFTACSSNDNPVVDPVKPVVQHEAWTQELIDALDQNPEAKGLLVKAIDIACKREGKCPSPWCRSYLLRFGGGGTFHHSRGIEY